MNLLDLASGITIEMSQLNINNIKELIIRVNSDLNELFNNPKDLLNNIDKIENINNELKKSLSLSITLENKDLQNELSTLLMKTNILNGIYFNKPIKKSESKLNNININYNLIDTKFELIKSIHVSTIIILSLSLGMFVGICIIIILIFLYI